METLFYIVKAHFLFLILGGIYHFVLKNEKSFTFNRFYLLAIYGASVLAPLLKIKLFENITLINPELLSSEQIGISLGSNSKSIEPNLFTFDILIPWIYGSLVSISLIIFIVKFVKSYYKFKHLHRIAKYDYKQQVYWVADNIPPFTFLNKTLLPEKLKCDENNKVIIRHEEAHRKTLHFFDIFWVEIFSSILIFNPFNKKIKKYVVENHEFQADEYACENTPKSNYAQILIHQTLKQNQLEFVSHFARPTILNRLDMLQHNKKSKSKPFLVAFSFALFSIVFACDLNPTEEFILKEDNKVLADASQNGEADENTIYSIVDDQAEPKEGIQVFYDAISKDMEGRYPKEAISKGIEGVVYLQFVIERDGSLSNIQPVKGIGGGCDELAVQVLKNNGNWIPGKHKGTTVRSQRVIPIRFVLR